MGILMAATVALCLIGSSAKARSHHHHYAGSRHHYAGRPGAWCGWFMRGQVGGDAGPSYSLARSGLIMDQMPLAHQSEPLMTGVITWARSSAKRTARAPGNGRDPVSAVRLPTEPTAAIDKWAEDHEANAQRPFASLLSSS
jgi:hypothetical protein